MWFWTAKIGKKTEYVHRRLYLEENLLPVQEIQQEPAHEHIARGEQDRAPGFGQERRRTAEEESAHAPQWNDLLHQVDGDGVQADDPEREGSKFRMPFK